MPDVLCLGEALIDWVCPQRGATLATATSFIRSPGGAPANVAVGLARLGVRTGFAGRISTDPWGTMLLETLAVSGVETEAVLRDSSAGTRMAYILLDEAGERHLAAFSHGACADAHLRHGDLRPESFDGVQVLYVSSLLQAHAASAEAMERAVGLAQEEGAIVFYDPNFRPVLWDKPARAREAISSIAGKADVLKMGHDELELLTGEADLVEGARLAQERFLPALLLVTDGPNGCFYVRDADEGHVPSIKVEVVDSTGAGDAFVAGLIAGLLPELQGGEPREAIANMEGSRLEAILHRANALGALVTTRTGAMTALPTAAELDAWLKAEGRGFTRSGLGWS